MALLAQVVELFKRRFEEVDEEAPVPHAGSVILTGVPDFNDETNGLAPYEVDHDLHDLTRGEVLTECAQAGPIRVDKPN